MKNYEIKYKGAQVSIFIILAIVILVGVGIYFLVKGDILKLNVPAEFKPVYNYYLGCIDEEVLNGAMIMGQQAGYIENPDFSPGTIYMPFSSELDFLGIGVPYWYYISGNGIKKEQVPSKEIMEEQLNDFVKKNLQDCDFYGFEENGFNVIAGDVESVETDIKDNLIKAKVKQNIDITLGERSWSTDSHLKDTVSNLGKFYNIAKKIYEYNKEKMFLENYGVDVLRLYAPVDGTEITCSPKIWAVDEIRQSLIDALEVNIPFTKIKGDYYSLSDKEHEYFVQEEIETDTSVNFMYLREWPMKMEVWPSEAGILKAEPVGTQEGLGMLGFCYVPYHFVYDFAYPVLIQVYSGSEMFQFPLVISIDKNNPREALDVEGLPNAVPELCENKNHRMSVYTYNTNLEPIEADIGFKCFSTTCNIGKSSSEDGVLTDNFPQCANGYLVASAEGYETKKQIVIDINSISESIVLEKKYKLDLEITESRDKIDNLAIITFTKNNQSVSYSYPEQKEIELSQGQYEIQVYVYSDSNINLAETNSEKCVDVPQSGLFGFLGFTEEKCFTIDIPSQVVDNAVSGGGSQKYYITESELANSKKINIYAKKFGIPTKIEDLQLNYNKVAVSNLNIEFA